jgi:hypothetical protein
MERKRRREEARRARQGAREERKRRETRGELVERFSAEARPTHTLSHIHSVMRRVEIEIEMS